MKKILILLVIFSSLCGLAYAQNESDFKTNGKGTIIGYDGWDTMIVIPAQIGGVPVTAIGDDVFKNMGITAITIPVNIKYIGENAFANNQLTSVIIPDGVSIGGSAFADNLLTNLVIGTGATIAYESFARNQLLSFSMGNGSSIGPDAFKNNILENIILGADIHFDAHVFGSFVFYDYLCNDRIAGIYNTDITYSIKTEGDYEFIEAPDWSVIIGYTGNEGNRLLIPKRLAGKTVKGIDGRPNRDTSENGAFSEKNP